MYAEIQEAMKFLCQFLFDKLPRRKVSLFSEQLANFLVMKFENHWYSENPEKGGFISLEKLLPSI